MQYAARGLHRGGRTERGNELFQRYGQAFPTAYRADWVARSAVPDIRRIDELPEHNGLAVSLYRPLEASESRQ